MNSVNYTESLHRALRAAKRDLDDSHYKMAELLYEFSSGKHYEQMGCASLDEYADMELGMTRGSRRPKRMRPGPSAPETSTAESWRPI